MNPVPLDRRLGGGGEPVAASRVRKHQPVTAESLAKFWLARRCRYGCVRPDHQTIAPPGRNRYLVREAEKVRTAAAIEAVRVRMKVLRAAAPREAFARRP